jgi:hypothetical protein
MAISFGDNLKAVLKQMWDSKKFSTALPKVHFDLDEQGHFQMNLLPAPAKASIDLPGNTDGLAVLAANKAAEVGNLAP